MTTVMQSSSHPGLNEVDIRALLVGGIYSLLRKSENPPCLKVVSNASGEYISDLNFNQTSAAYVSDTSSKVLASQAIRIRGI